MSSHSRIDLNCGWSFKQRDLPDSDWLSVTKVPTQVHLDLLHHKKIPDPFLDLNERAVQWVGEKSWVYRLKFQVTGDTAKHTDLVFEGLDTFATVYLNGTEILSTDNMFLSYRVSVTDKIKTSSNNILEIVFDSALLRGRELVKSHSHEHNFFVRQTEVGRVPVRKAQYNWGWDWGPILMTAGPWKPIYLEQYAARVDDLWAENVVSPDLKTCSGTIFANVAGYAADEQVMVTLSRNDKVLLKQEARLDDNGLARVEFEIQTPELWYPLHYGPQARYQLQATIVRDKAELHALSKLVGFRRTELVQEPDAHGKSFYFRINNTDVFAGGSCWIPADSFLPQISSQRYHDWIKLMTEGNQVMIRVWGGGVYEDDALLDACDELGVLVWHDFQFACASYPTYPSYLKNVEAEATQQIRRLRWRPSVVAWAGNNEDYQVQERFKLDYDFDNKDPNTWLKSSFPARYISEYLLPKLVEKEDPNKIYHPSSPWGDGKPTADPTVGDIHQWNLWHAAMNKYQEVGQLTGRFVSEFGMEAYPHLSTTRRMVTEESQLYPGSMSLDFHNKAIGHERRMMSYVAENFQVRTGLAEFIHLTQVVQAESMRFAYKTWRRDWGRPGARKCGGVLVWQLNDCWPTMSWAVVDYYLVKKPAYYAISRALRVLDIGVSRTYHDWTQTGDYVDENSKLYTGQVDQTLSARESFFDVWVASSSVCPVDLEVSVRFISVGSGKDISPSLKYTISALANSTTEVVQQYRLPAAIPSPEDSTRPFSVSEYDPFVVHASANLPDGTVIADTAWPDPIKFLDLSNRQVSFDVSPAGDSITVSALKPVKSFVFEEVEGLRLSDNGFDLVPGEKQTIAVAGAVPADDLRCTFVGAPRASMKVSDLP